MDRTRNIKESVLNELIKQKQKEAQKEILEELLNSETSTIEDYDKLINKKLKENSYN